MRNRINNCIASSAAGKTTIVTKEEYHCSLSCRAESPDSNVRYKNQQDRNNRPNTTLSSLRSY